MANNRTEEIIYSRIEPISDELKQKCATAFQDVVDRIKDKHLS